MGFRAFLRVCGWMWGYRRVRLGVACGDLRVTGGLGFRV